MRVPSPRFCQLSSTTKATSAVSGWSKMALRVCERSVDDLGGQAGRFIGKRGCGGRPTGGDGIARRHTPDTFQVFECKHIVVAEKLKREAGPCTKRVQARSIGMEGPTES